MKPVPPTDVLVDLKFPAAGQDSSMGFERQPNKPLPATGDYARTTAEGINVRGFEQLTQRIRGGSRPGLAKYIPVAPVADWIIQELNIIVVTSAAAVGP